MIAKIIPVERRGRFFGITNFIGNGAGILGAIAVPFVLDRFEFPLGYVMAFTFASVLIFISWVFLSLTRQLPVPYLLAVFLLAHHRRRLPRTLE